MMKKIHNLKLFGLVAFLAFALVFIGVDFIEGQKKETKGKPDKPPGQGKKGDDAFQDMPLCIVFGPGEEIGPLVTNDNPLCDSISGVTAFAGRRWGIGFEIHKNTSDPSFFLTLGDRLPVDTGDPNPATDGGYYEYFCDPPDLGDDGRIFVPQFGVGVGKECPNIKDMPINTPLPTDAQLIFEDDDGDEYHLFWGPGPWPGDNPWTNPSAPDVKVVRNHDIIIVGDDQSNWNVTTNKEDRIDPADETGYEDVHTAFLWKLSKPWTWDYCGAFDVSFSYFAIEE
jgi:hypothetical protein